MTLNYACIMQRIRKDGKLRCGYLSPRMTLDYNFYTIHQFSEAFKLP